MYNFLVYYSNFKINKNSYGVILKQPQLWWLKIRNVIHIDIKLFSQTTNKITVIITYYYKINLLISVVKCDTPISLALLLCYQHISPVWSHDSLTRLWITFSKFRIMTLWLESTKYGTPLIDNKTKYSSPEICARFMCRWGKPWSVNRSRQKCFSNTYSNWLLISRYWCSIE